MRGVTLRPVEEEDRAWIRETIASRWAADYVVAHGATYVPHRLSGVVAQAEDGTRVGLATYLIDRHECELVTIDSLKENLGIGSLLLEAVVEIAMQSNCRRVWLVTTNDNTNALAFYQKRGFVLKRLLKNEVLRSRRLKPSIPLVASNGIPILDEIELERTVLQT